MQEKQKLRQMGFVDVDQGEVLVSSQKVVALTHAGSSIVSDASPLSERNPEQGKEKNGENCRCSSVSVDCRHGCCRWAFGHSSRSFTKPGEAYEVMDI